MALGYSICLEGFTLTLVLRKERPRNDMITENKVLIKKKEEKNALTPGTALSKKASSGQ